MTPGKSPAELYQQRVKRVEDAVALKVPDRIPLVPIIGFFVAKYTGITVEDLFYNPVKLKEATRKTIVDLAPDMYWAAPVTPGPVLDALGCNQVKLPGHGLPPESSQQYVEHEYMKRDEYQAFLDDPTGFALSTYIPRSYDALEALKDFPPLTNLYLGYPEIAFAEFFSRPNVLPAIEAMAKAGREAVKWNSVMGTFTKEMGELGFPSYTATRSMAPFDILSDYMRGLRGSMLDLYRDKDMVVAACEKLLPVALKKSIESAKRTGNPRIALPLHRGAESFMSAKQFETFYWPTFKKLIWGIADAGLTPIPFFEGNYTSRLEYLLELPKGKCIGMFDTTDIFKAKEVLGGHMCVAGNFPLSLLQAASEDDVRAHCKKLIDTVAKNGGYIMSSQGQFDNANPKNVLAMMDYFHKNGQY